jgi:hypothetical protein
LDFAAIYFNTRALGLFPYTTAIYFMSTTTSALVMFTEEIVSIAGFNYRTPKIQFGLATIILARSTSMQLLFFHRRTPPQSPCSHHITLTIAEERIKNKKI